MTVFVTLTCVPSAQSYNNDDDEDDDDHGDDDDNYALHT